MVDASLRSRKPFNSVESTPVPEQPEEIKKQNLSARILESFQWILVAIIIVLAAYVRFSGLSYPNGPVFDEAIYTQIVSNYKTGTFFLDQNPPLGKLLFYKIAEYANLKASPIMVQDILTDYRKERLMLLNFLLLFYARLRLS